MFLANNFNKVRVNGTESRKRKAISLKQRADMFRHEKTIDKKKMRFETLLQNYPDAAVVWDDGSSTDDEAAADCMELQCVSKKVPARSSVFSLQELVARQMCKRCFIAIRAIDRQL